MKAITVRTVRNGYNCDGRTSGGEVDAVMTQFNECTWYVLWQILFNKKDQEDIHPVPSHCTKLCLIPILILLIYCSGFNLI